MTYIEFFDESALENISTCLTNKPDRVIYIGNDLTLMNKHIDNYKKVLSARNFDIEFISKTVPRSKLESAINVLSDIVEQYDDCVFDITGGDEMYTLALGIVYANHPNRGIQIHKMNLKNNSVYDCDRDGKTVFKETPVLSVLCLDAVRFIENQGYNAFPIAASQSTNDDKSAYRGVFAHKTGACLSGIGYIGKNALLYTKEYGSKVRLATVLTDMPLVRQREIIKGGCGDCDICKRACPAGAISGINYEVGMARDDFYSADKCSSHMKTYKDVGRGAVCGICIKACPKNKLK